MIYKYLYKQSSMKILWINKAGKSKLHHFQIFQVFLNYYPSLLKSAVLISTTHQHYQELDFLIFW